MTATPDTLSQASNLEQLYGLLKPLNVGPGWAKPTPSLWPAPRQTMLPAHWSYAHAKGALQAAGRLINTELAERRNLILINPQDGNDYATVRTLVAAYQAIMPGEQARSHRHTPNALRLILDAEPGTYTVVDGVKLPMSEGDVLLTPNWAWHGHGNDSPAAAFWLDFLDVPLVQLLEPMFLEMHPEHFEHVTEVARASPMWFPWRDTIARLDAATKTPDGPYATQIELGAPAMGTIALHMMQLRPGTWTAPLQTTESIIYAVAQGSGVSRIDGQEFPWSRGDVLAAPAWRPHQHCAGTDAVLLRVSDTPVLDKLNLLRVAAPH